MSGYGARHSGWARVLLGWALVALSAVLCFSVVWDVDGNPNTDNLPAVTLPGGARAAAVVESVAEDGETGTPGSGSRGRLVLPGFLPGGALCSGTIGGGPWPFLYAVPEARSPALSLNNRDCFPCLASWPPRRTPPPATVADDIGTAGSARPIRRTTRRDVRAPRNGTVSTIDGADFRRRLPQSGTTMLRNMLDAHPNISCGPESGFLQSFDRWVESTPSAGRVRDHLRGVPGPCG